MKKQYSLEQLSQKFLDCCKSQRMLSEKTLSAYATDLEQLLYFISSQGGALDRSTICEYISHLHSKYEPRSAKRKIGTVKTFCGYLAYEELIDQNPFDRINTRFQAPAILPRTIPLSDINAILSAAYAAYEKPLPPYLKKAALRDIAVIELLFATGVRVAELCSLSAANVNLNEGAILLLGKGAKERIVQIGNPDVLAILRQYCDCFRSDIDKSGFFFINRLHSRLSEQSVRAMLTKCADMANVTLHITPHMFRHSFASFLLEEDVDIRYIQRLLGHSSITTTQIYTHVTSNKQREILATKHPRNKINI